jgi:hypothetical protein
LKIWKLMCHSTCGCTIDETGILRLKSNCTAKRIESNKHVWWVKKRLFFSFFLIFCCFSCDIQIKYLETLPTV